MRAIWKGSITFGLVNIPIALYSATKSANELKLRLLRKKDQSAVQYKRVAQADGQEVPWDEIVKGYEYEKGSFVILTDEDFERVNIKSRQTIEIHEFVDLEQIDPMFFDVPYFLAPEKGGAKAYALLCDALKQSKKVGIAKVVLKTREHLAAVKPLKNALVLELMHFADELQDPESLGLPSENQIGKKELEMALALIEGMTDEWKPEKYSDAYREALMAVIEEKIKSGGKKGASRKPASAPPTNVVNLVDILQQSLAQTRGKGKKAEKAAAGRK